MALIRGLVVADLAAGQAIVDPVFAQAHVDFAQAEQTVSRTRALLLGQVALVAEIFFPGSAGCAHTPTLNAPDIKTHVPKVIPL